MPTSWVKKIFQNKPSTLTPLTADELNNLGDQYSAAKADTKTELAEDAGNPGSAFGAALSSTFGAVAIANPETEIHDAVAGVVDDRLGGGAANFVQYVDAREDLSIARPSTLGQVVWYINTGDNDPIHVADGDVVQEVDVEEIPWTPSMLPNKVVWLDAQALGLADGASVASWTDLSGNGNHAVQADSAKQPAYDIDKINGHAAVVADGVNDTLTIALAEAYAAGAFTLYLFAGTDLADNTSGSDFLVAGAGTAETVGTQLNLYRTTNETFYMRRGTNLESAASTWTTGSKKIRLVFDGLNSSLRVNGVTMATGQTTVSGTSLVGLSLFANYNDTNHGPFWMGEFLLVRGTVSDTLDAKIVSYWDRWNA